MELTVERRSSPRIHDDGSGDLPRVAVRRTGDIACVPPFELRCSLAFLTEFTPTLGEQSIDRGVLTKAIAVSGRPLGVRLFQPRGANGAPVPKLRVALASERPIDDATAAAAMDRVAFVLGANEDLAPFYAVADGDGGFAAVARRLRGFHHVKFPTPFEAACWAVLNQRVGTVVARRMKDALVREAGGAVDLDDGYRAFPEAQDLLRLGEARIAALLGHERKAKAVWAVSRAFADVSDAFLREGPHGEVKEWLLRIHGVGEFTAGFVLFRGLGRLDHLPEVPAFGAAARAVYGRALSSDDIAACARRYGSWAGHWMLYVWASTFSSMPRA
jgi:DNA-3-methyladenine glycosylase II